MKPVNEILDDAFKRIRKPSAFIAGEQIETALSEINEIYQSWVSRGLLLWCINTVDIPTVDGQSTYDLPEFVSEILNVQRMDSNNFELPMVGVNRDQYVGLPNKDLRGGPLQYYQTQDYQNMSLILWPVPDATPYTIRVWNKRSINEVQAASDVTNIPKKWEGAMVSALAAKLYATLPTEEYDINMHNSLSSRAELDFQIALSTESDGTVINLVPNIRAYTR